MSPVGFAREPGTERRRWIGRIFLAILLALILWLLVNRVFKPPATQGPIPQQSQLPAG